MGKKVLQVAQPKLAQLEIFNFPGDSDYASFVLDGEKVAVNTTVRDPDAEEPRSTHFAGVKIRHGQQGGYDRLHEADRCLVCWFAQIQCRDTR